MNLICTECTADLDLAIKSLHFTSNWQLVSAIDLAELSPISETSAFTTIEGIRSDLVSLRTSENMIFGGVLLYSAGRFEAYVKDVIIEMCGRLVTKAGEYRKLPKALRTNLPKFTGIVIQDPRKYGHADAGAAAFIQTMHENLSGTAPFSKINTECITITDANMRPDVVADLFKRIGFDNVFERIASQSGIMTYFETSLPDKSLADLKTKLNDLMDLRNTIAHPKPSMTWPSKDVVVDYINFLKIVATELDGQSNVFVAGYNPAG